MYRQLLYRSGFYFLMAIMLVLSLLPIEHPDISPNDKINHLIGYGSLMIAGYLAYRRVAMIAAIVFGFGALVEVLQGMTGYRFMSLGDVVANSAGIALGCTVIFLVSSLQKSINSKGSNHDE